MAMKTSKIDGRKVKKVIRLFGVGHGFPIMNEPILLTTGAKLYKREDGYYISGYAYDDSDVNSILEKI